MFIYTNPNPYNKFTGDCVIRAIAVITNSTWEKAYTDLCAEGLLQADLPNESSVWGSYLRKLGFKREIISNSCPDCYTIEDFANEFPYGEYVVCTGTHTVAVIDGLIYDTADSSQDTPIYYYYKEK